jgi:FlaA1/EpsC-like NDP-sugar epimerase
MSFAGLSRPHHRVLIYGAGEAGRQLALAMRLDKEMKLVGFVEDNRALIGRALAGAPIYDSADIAQVAARRGVSEVLMAVPSAKRTRRMEIVRTLIDAGLKVRTLPTISDLAHGRVSVTDLREVQIDDLLGRASVEPNLSLLCRNIHDQVVMVTGAGGSIGSELVRQIHKLSPRCLILVDASEFHLYAITHELTDAQDPGSAPALVPLLASVCDADRMRQILETWRPDTIYHAAAYKHVPMVEWNVVEGVRNNVVGTMVTATLAGELGVKNFTLISTDKAVRPTNVMGASKRLAEMILQSLSQESQSTCFSMVRFGNVLGSSGSVVPLFKKQIAAGGPVTVTDERMTRYFMTIPEAAQLVIQAGALAEGGDVFLLDMGEPVRIIDLARNMIELSGLHVRDENNPEGDIAIEVVGLRHGEKLYEELLIEADAQQTPHPGIMRAKENSPTPAQLRNILAELQKAFAAGDGDAARAILRRAVPEFVPSSDLADLVVHARTAARAPEAPRTPARDAQAKFG